MRYEQRVACGAEEGRADAGEMMQSTLKKEKAEKKKRMKRTSTCRAFDPALGKTTRAIEAKSGGATASECARDGMTIDEIMFVSGCTYGTARTLKYNANCLGYEVPNEGSEARAIPRAEHIRALIMEGKSNAEIATECNVTEKTASYHRSALRKEVAAAKDDAVVPRSPAPRRPERIEVERLLREADEDREQGRQPKTHAAIAEETGTYAWYVASVAQDMREGGYRSR